MYPLQAKCTGCPVDPSNGTGATLNPPDAFVSRYAAIESKISGIEISAKEDQGWSWLELENNSGPFPAPGQPANRRVHYEALKLLAVFVQHGDRKPEQQKLICPTHELLKSDLVPNAKGVYQETTESVCGTPVAYIHDLGATFGGAGAITSGNGAKMNLSRWSDKTIFNESIIGKRRE